MRKILTSIALFVLLTTAVVAFAACGGNANDESKQTGGKTNAEVSITLSQTTLSVEEFASATLLATTENFSGELEWRSLDESVATVDGGAVYGVAPGETTITVKAGDKTASVAVTVTEGSFMPTITTDVEEIDLLKGGDYELYAAVYFRNEIADSEVSFQSEDDSVATVSAQGKVTGVAHGSTDITVPPFTGARPRVRR